DSAPRRSSNRPAERKENRPPFGAIRSSARSLRPIASSRPLSGHANTKRVAAASDPAVPSPVGQEVARTLRSGVPYEPAEQDEMWHRPSNDYRDAPRAG